MHTESELPPSPVAMDDTPVPVEVAEKVEALQAEGKTVNVRISVDEYAKLMQMPHEARLAYAMRVMAEQDKRAAAKQRLDDRRRARRAMSRNRRK